MYFLEVKTEHMKNLSKIHKFGLDCCDPIFSLLLHLGVPQKNTCDINRYDKKLKTEIKRMKNT